MFGGLPGAQVTGRLPGLERPGLGQRAQLGDPAADIVALRVEFFGLADRVEEAEIWRGVGPAAGGPLPAEGVVGQVGIDQGVPKPGRALAPGDQ